MAAPTVLAALRQVLLPHAPFSLLAEADVDFLLAHVEIAYYAPGELILQPSDEVAPYCWIVKQGGVRGLQRRPDRSQAERIAFEAGTGDCFPVGALLAERPVSLDYVAVGDTFCLLLPRPRFFELTRRSEPFNDFCRRRLGALLDLSRRELQASYANEASAERTMGMSLGALARGTPITCRPDDSLREAFSLMSQAHVGSVIVTETFPGGEEVLGILTRTDLIDRVILPERPLSTPIREVMTRDVMTLDANATAADATLLMAEHSIRHVPVVQARGGVTRVVGVVSERDLFALQRLSVRQLAMAIRVAPEPLALATIADDVRRLSHHLVAQGVAAAQLTRLISHLNDQLTGRLLDMACERFGVKADHLCWLALGSEGRAEQTIATDQDNGLIYVEGAAPRETLLELAEWVNQALAQAGFPLCSGEIMARNPRWCATLGAWQHQFFEWIERGDPQALLNASIFFDLRGIYGNRNLALQLREDVVLRAQRTPRFLKQMADNALRNGPPSAGWFDAIVRDDASDPVDLKLNGTVPFVDAARIWALAAGLRESNTIERLQLLADLGRLPAGDVVAWVDSFEFLQLMRLHAQHRRRQDNHAHPNRIEPRELSPLDRRILKEAFRQARKLQQRLELDYPG